MTAFDFYLYVCLLLLALCVTRTHSLDFPQGQHAQQHVFPNQRSDNNGIHLAVSPVCGTLSGSVSDVNAGVNLKDIKVIVAFGVRLAALSLPHLTHAQPGLLHRRGT